MAKRKYTKRDEEPKAFECTNRKCKWAGTPDQKSKKKNPNGWIDDICPNCGKNEFYGLLEIPNNEQ